MPTRSRSAEGGRSFTAVLWRTGRTVSPTIQRADFGFAVGNAPGIGVPGIKPLPLALSKGSRDWAFSLRGRALSRSARILSAAN